MIGALILAAGASTRMGRPKAGLPLSGGQTFLSRVVRTLTSAGLPRIAVVLGAHEEEVRRAWQGRSRTVQFVRNAGWERGQLSSVLAGLDAMRSPVLEGLLVTLVDVPLVSVDTVRALVAAWRRTRAPVVRPVMGTRHGHPVIFDRATFAALAAADPAMGAKAVVRAFQAGSLSVPVTDRGAFLDADTPDDYSALLRAGDA
jgi:molybdenum cofactor cytidylyltransferase